MQYDASDPKQVRQARQWSKVAEQRRHAMLNAIMELPDGRAWMYDLLEFCGVRKNPFSSNALFMAYGCGELNVGLWVLADLMAACPDKYLLMVSERKLRDDGHDEQQRGTDERTERRAAEAGGLDYDSADYDGGEAFTPE